MAAQNKPQRVIKVSADEYLEELKKMYFKTKYIKRGAHSDTGGVAFHGRLRVAICGHVDTHGASTGRLIFELESLSECEKDRLEQEALELHQSRAGFFRTFCHFYQSWLEKHTTGVPGPMRTPEKSSLTTPSLKMAQITTQPPTAEGGCGPKPSRRQSCKTCACKSTSLYGPCLHSAGRDGTGRDGITEPPHH